MSVGPLSAQGAEPGMKPGGGALKAPPRRISSHPVMGHVLSSLPRLLDPSERQKPSRARAVSASEIVESQTLSQTIQELGHHPDLVIGCDVRSPG